MSDQKWRSFRGLVLLFAAVFSITFSRPAEAFIEQVINLLFSPDQGGSGRGNGEGYESPYSAISFVETGKSYVPRAPDLEKGVVQCPGSASFRWYYAGTSPASCAPMVGNTRFLSLLDRSFMKCVAAGARVAGIRANSKGGFTGQVFHAGLEGDARHQATKSNHNIGSALDIKSIVVNGKVMDFSQATAQYQQGVESTEFKFYNALRACWSKEIVANNAACASSYTRAGYCGSLGWDDKRHQNHMHLSMPTCDGRFFMAMRDSFTRPLGLLARLFGTGPADAAIPEKADLIQLILSNNALVQGKAVFVGEPVSEPVQILMKAKCPGKNTKPIALESYFSVCDYVSITEDKTRKKIVLSYLESRFNEKEGNFVCGAEKRKEYDNPCSAGAKAAVKPEAALPAPALED